jgi:hypothetical protein
MEGVCYVTPSYNGVIPSVKTCSNVKLKVVCLVTKPARYDLSDVSNLEVVGELCNDGFGVTYRGLNRQFGRLS